MRRDLAALIGVSLLSGGFCWGYLSHRNHLPPHGLLSAVYRAAERHDPEPTVFEIGEQLAALGYTDAARPVEKSGVLLYDQAETAPGVNLFSSGEGAIAYLMENDGTVIHRWEQGFYETWPEGQSTGHGTGYWHRVALLPDGGLLAIFYLHGMVRLDREGRTVWALPGAIHHELAIDGTVVRSFRRSERAWDDGRVLYDDEIVTIDLASGQVLRSLSILDAFASSDHSRWLQQLPPGPDVFHANALQLLGPDTLAPDQFLICIRELDLVATIDPKTARVTWTLPGPWRRPHRARLLDNGHLLIFNNLAAADRSEALELDPTRQTVQWRWGTGLFSETMGATQRLDNGNTLIIESEGARAIEVTAEGTPVWTFANPGRTADGAAAVLPDLQRMPRPEWATTTAPPPSPGSPI